MGIYASSYGIFIEVQQDGTMKIMDNADSGFFVQGEIRDIKAIQIAGARYFLVARNDDTLKIFAHIK